MMTRCICGIASRKGWGTRSIVSTQVAVVFGWSAFFIFRLWILHSGRDDDFHGQLFVDRADIVPPRRAQTRVAPGTPVVTAAAIVKDADDGFLFALHHADDPAFSFAVMPEAAHFH